MRTDSPDNAPSVEELMNQTIRTTPGRAGVLMVVRIQRYARQTELFS